MKLMAPANYDLTILPQLAERSVGEIYGRLASDAVGGGRPAYMGGPMGRTRLRRYIQTVHAAGMEFN